MTDRLTAAKPTLTVQTFWLMFARTVGFVLSVGLPILLVRLFDQKQYGVYKQAFVVVQTTYSLLNLGVGLSAFYYMPRKTEGRSLVALNIVAFNVVAGAIPLVVLFLFPRVLGHIFGGPQLVPYARVIGWIMFLTITSAFLEVVATAMQDVKWSTVFIVFAQLSRVVLMTAAALWWRSIEGLLYAAVAQGLLQSAVLIWYLHNRFGRFWTSFDWRFFREQIGYAAPYGLYGMLAAAQGDVHNYFVANVFGPSAFAIYSIGCMQIPLIFLLRDSLSAVLISKISELQHQGRERDILLLTARAMRKTALLCLPVYALLMVTGHDILVFFYTRAYEGSWPIFAINLTTLLLLVVITDPIVRAYAEHRYFIVRVRIAILCLQVVALWFATRAIGMKGAILVVVLSAVLERAIVVRRLAGVLGMRLKDVRLFKGIGKIALVSAGCAGATLVVRAALSGVKPFVVLAVCGTSFALLFIGLALLLRLLEPDEEELIRRQWLRLRRAAAGGF